MKYLLVLTFLFYNAALHAQTRTIKGKVTDKKGTVLLGATVMIQGTQKGAIADLDGYFKLENVDPGVVTLVCSYISFEPSEKTITVLPDKEIRVDFVLSESELTLDAVVVTAARKTDTEAAVLMEVKNAKQIVNAVSAEEISKTQDSDASEVIRRVPGVTIVGNNYIMIRGLNERYNTVMLNDVFAPSMEADVKSFAFDIIPSGLLDRMLIYKSPAPDLPGEFAGGVVKIYTKSIPDSNSFSFSTSIGLREGSSFKNFLQSPRSDLHMLGVNDGYNDLPSGFPADVRNVGKDSDSGDKIGQMLKNNWVPQQVNSSVDKGVSLTKATRWRTKGRDLGNITSISYSNARTIFDSERSDFNAYDNVNNVSVPIYEFDDRQYTHKIRTGILHNWALRLNSNNIIEFKNMFNLFNTTQYVNRRGYDIEYGYAPDNHSFDQVYRGIYSGQLKGTHDFNRSNSTFSWTAGYGYSYRDQPDYRRYRSQIDTSSGDKSLFIGVPLSPNYLGRFYSEMRENSMLGNVALDHMLNIGSFSPKLKTGILVENKNRTFSARNIGYVRANILFFDENLVNTTIDSLFMPQNINGTTGIKIGEQTNPSDSYDASNLLMSYYAGTDLPFTNKLLLSTGVRLEHNTQKLNSFSLTKEPIVVNNPILNVLPSANLSYNFTDKMLIRGAYGMTVNRPEFRELAPFSFYDFNFNLVKKGSENLKTPTIHNFDLRWENYPSPTEMISVALFYKRFKDPIETLFIPGGGSGGIKTFSYGNAKLATSYGIEVEIRKSLFELTSSKFIDNLTVLFNGSLIKSQVELGMEQLGQSNERPMQGQSPYIANAGIYYQDKLIGFQASLVYNIIGPRIFIIGFDTYPDIYEMPRNILDFALTKVFMKKYEIKFGVGDIINQEFLLVQDANDNGKLERETDQTIQRYRMGRTYSLGLGYKF